MFNSNEPLNGTKFVFHNCNFLTILLENTFVINTMAIFNEKNHFKFHKF